MPQPNLTRQNIVTNDPSEGISIGETIRILAADMSGSISNTYSFTTESFEYIQNHNYVPNFIFHRVALEPELYMGAEIEIDEGGKKDDIAKYIINFLGNENVYCKHDGSLANGFEVVTHPCTFEYYNLLPIEPLFKYLSENKYRAHDTSTCGLHIHFNRNYFGNDKLIQDLSISNLLYLFEKFWEKVVLIARRDSNRYAQRFYLSQDETSIDIYAKSKNTGKYGSINLQHKDTVEIRIYKGTLNASTFYNTLEFTKVMVEIAKEVSIYNIQEITWNIIFDRFSDNLKEYIKDREIKVKTEKPMQTRSEPITYIDGSWIDNIPTISQPPNNLVYDVYETMQRHFEEVQPANEVQQIRDQMTNLNRRINRSRNGLERIQLQRELGELSRSLPRRRH